MLMRNFLKVFLLVAVASAPSVFSQQTKEEERRIDFVKSLSKKREKTKSAERKATQTATVPTTTASPETSEDEEIIKVDTKLVRVDVLVHDKKGKAVLGLQASDFVIKENNVQQEIGTFSLGTSEDIPRSIVLILDYSNSQRPFIRTSVLAAKLLVEKLNPRDRMAIVTDDIELVVDFTRDKQLLKNSLDKLGRKAEKGDVGRSLQFSALYAAVREMFDEEDVRPIVIFQTDADQLLSIRTETMGWEQRTPNTTTFTDRDLLTTLERSRVTLYSVISGVSILGLQSEEQIEKVRPVLEQQYPKELRRDPTIVERFTRMLNRQQGAMVNIAKLSGGFAENLETPEQADAIYENILRGINDRYLIGYYPDNQTPDGKRRNVRVEVKDRPDLTVIGRKFYFAPKQ